MRAHLVERQFLGELDCRSRAGDPLLVVLRQQRLHGELRVHAGALPGRLGVRDEVETGVPVRPRQVGEPLVPPVERERNLGLRS